MNVIEKLVKKEKGAVENNLQGQFMEKTHYSALHISLSLIPVFPNSEQ